MDDETRDILTLMDEDGQEREFELLDSAELDGFQYVALTPIYQQPEDLLDDTGEMLVLKAIEEGGEEYLEPIDDEEEFDRVGAFFMNRLADDFDFEEEEEEELI